MTRVAGDMQVTFLGTGAAGGVPLYGCDCGACRRASKEPRYRREPCSALVEASGTRVLIDGGLMDLHHRFRPGELDAILLTHFHADHVQGLFHLRWGRGEPIPVFIPPDNEGCADLFKHPGLLDFRVQTAFAAFQVGNLSVTPVPLNHSKPTFGYHLQAPGDTSFSYLTDTCGLPEPALSFLRQQRPDGLAIDCTSPPRLQPSAHSGHNDWQQALQLVADIGPARGWLTHIRHDLDDWLLQSQPSLPGTVKVARDGERATLVPARHHS